MREGGCNVEVSPHLEPSGGLTQSRKPGQGRGEPSFPLDWLGRFSPRGALPLRNAGLASLPGLHPRGDESRAHLGTARQLRDRERASVAYGQLLGHPRNPRENVSRAKPCLPAVKRGWLLPPYGHCGRRLTAPNLAAANLTRAPSHHSHSSSFWLSRPGRLRLARHTRLPRTFLAEPAGTAPHAQAARAGTRRPPGEVFLESGRAPGRALLLTCVFFIRKGCAVLQPRQRCGDSV